MGKAGALEFGLPPSNERYGTLQQLKSLTRVELDGEEIFRGRVLSRERSFNNLLATYCEGDLAYLIDSVQRPEKYTGTAHALFPKIIAAHNAMVEADKRFTVGNITVPDRAIVLAGQSDDVESLETDAFNYKQIVLNSITDEWMTTYDYLKTSLLDYCGGYLRTRKVGSIVYIDWIAEYYDTASQEIELGINMLDLTEEISVEDLFTVLIPLGDDNLTIESVNNGSKELVDSAAVAKYGRIVKTHVFSNVTSAATLLENGQRYLADKTSSQTTLTVKAVDMHFLDPTVKAIHLGDRVRVYSEPHGLSSYLVCTKIEYDLANPANNTYTFGNPKQSLTERYREDKRKQDDIHNSAGGSGGAAGAAAEHDWHLVDETVGDAVEQVTGETDDKFQEFFDAWINVDPSAGNINLGALYRKVEDYKTVLENNVGINLDAPSGIIDIFADHTQWANDRLTLKNNVGINLDAPAGTINIYTTAATANDASSKCASIILWAGTDANGNLGSNIALNADLVKVSNRLEAIEGVFDSISSDTISISKYLSVGRIYASGFVRANTFYDQGSIATGNRLAAQRHTHSFTVDSDGTVHIGAADLAGDDHSFNIADTKIYKDAVSAVTVSSVTISTEISSNGKYFDITATAKNADGTVLKTKSGYTANTAYTNGYNAGYAAAPGDSSSSVSCTSVNYSSGPHTGPYGSKYLNVVVYLSNGNSYTKSVYYNG